MNNNFGVNLTPEMDFKRIQTLQQYQVLNSKCETAFEQLVELTSQIFNVPISLISFVAEDVVVFKAKKGLEDMNSVPRNSCPCDLTIRSKDVTVLHNANVGGYSVAFYAGAPIVCPNGTVLGALSIMDHKPVDFSMRDSQILQGLANLVVEQLEARLSNMQQLEDSIHKNGRIQNKQRWKNMVMSAPMGMAVLQGRQLLIEIVNQPMLNFWGLRLEEVIGKPMAEALPESFRADLPVVLTNIFDTAIPLVLCETSLPVLTGQMQKQMYADVTYDPLFDLNGNVDAIMVTVINITEIVEARKLLVSVNKEIEAKNKLFVKANDELADTQETLKIIIGELANSEARFRGVFERAPLGMALLTGEDKVIDFANDNMLKIWGKKSDVIGLPHRVAVPELEDQGFGNLIDEVYKTGLAYKGHEQKAVTIQNGAKYKGYYNFVYEPLKDEKGATSILIIADDVTDEVQTRELANRTSQMLNMAVESAELGTWFIDLESLDFIPSPKLKSLFGFKPDEKMPYLTAASYISPDYKEQVMSAIASALKNGESYDLEFPIKDRQSEATRWLRATGNLNKPEPDRPSYFSGIIMDVTGRKLDEQRKNDFIAMVSHELKTPLTSLKAYIQILSSKATKIHDEYAVIALGKAELQVNRMNNLIKSFLDVARLEAGQININLEYFDISKLLEEVTAEAAEVMSSHELCFQPCKEVIVQADKDKIAQVITNFLSNAAKYSAKGKQIWVNCAEKNGSIQISVKDEGIGILKEDMEKLFNRFYRIDNTITRTISGFGIGLYLCAEIIKRHNGQIWVESEAGAGSTFYFSIPRRATI
jgi:two-component system sensor histidine kinase VicK